MEKGVGKGELLRRLSDREQQVLRLLCDGFEVPEIAKLLVPQVGVSTVYTYTTAIAIKLGIDGLGRGAKQRELGLFCAEFGRSVVEPPAPGASGSTPRPPSALTGATSRRMPAPVAAEAIRIAVVVYLRIFGAAEFAASQPPAEYHGMLRALQQTAHDSLQQYAKREGLSPERWHAQGSGDECLVVLSGGRDGEDEVHALRLAVWLKQSWISSPYGQRLAQGHCLGLLPQVDLLVGVGRGDVVFDRDVWTGAITPQGLPLLETKAIGEASNRYAPQTYILVKLDIREVVEKAALGVSFGELTYLNPVEAYAGLYQVPVFPVISWGEFAAAQERLMGTLPRPETASGLFHQALSLQRSGRTEEACEAYAAALELQPDYIDAWNNLGVGLFGGGRYPEAIRAYQEVISRDTRDAMAWYNLGLAYRALNQPGPALDAYRRATALRLNYPEAWNELALLYNEEKDFSAALEALETALSVAPDFGDTLYNLACTHALRGEAEQALEFLRQAVNAEPLKYRVAALEDSDLEVLRELPEFLQVVGTSDPA